MYTIHKIYEFTQYIFSYFAQEMRLSEIVLNYDIVKQTNIIDDEFFQFSSIQIHENWIFFGFLSNVEREEKELLYTRDCPELFLIN